MFEDAMRKLRDLQRRAEQLDGQHEVSFDDLFPDEFMLRNTEYPSIAELLSGSGFRIETAEDFHAIPDETWDNYIRQHTRFDSWGEMQRAAAEEWMVRQLGLQ